MLKLLKTSLNYVPQYGFTESAIKTAALHLGYPQTAHKIIENGSIDLINHFLDSSKDEMTRNFTLQDTSSLKTTAKIKLLCMIRLNLLKPYSSHWQQALTLIATSPSTLSKLPTLADEMWYLAGDTSTDLNWYSKRALLASVYASTELFMTVDKSLNYSDTERFLDDRLKDVGTLGRTFNSTVQLVEFGLWNVKGIFNSKFSK